ncbi:signal peptidase I [Clostridium perfringens]|uniref:signal peptidase I n=1 Tax=Clostridium perfringens TaxID=1502 RepID=UPI0013E3355C|nr:signal peptidase I [Clostridium perfringens]MCX0409136.1 signal peptidase I [Clostridium perfringens]MDM1007177.1 signal peptidase I [Clostridium perfringens]MDU5249564.1 signal peptidase I [Clostridium perfringens]NGT85206.1 signal peptidase I [Clostridium perfringens]BDA35374.1 signal peptidase I W [Clostridium perfringens]
MNSKNIFNTIYYIVIFMLVIILVNNFMSKSDSIFKAVGFRTYSILSGSMEPEINTGDLAIVKSVDAEDVKVGEIITFKYEGKVVTHRVVKKNEEGFITKGDNNNANDTEIVGREDLIGKVLFHMPFLGYVTVFLSKPIVISGLMVIIAISILWDTFKVDKKKTIKA